jgi:molecular chaperone GrpE
MSEPHEEPQDDEQLDTQGEPGPDAQARALQALLEEKERELATMKDQALRALAEVENTRRRSERDIADMNKFAVSNFARDLVSVLENLQRATDSIPTELKKDNPAVASLATGVEMTLKELLAVFERHGIKRIDPLGQKFDHNFHQAVAQVESDNQEAGTVLQVLQAGYTIHDRLLRPAMVAVATANNSTGALNTQA